MAITIIGETTHGTFEELMEKIRDLNDKHEVLTITCTFGKPRRPNLTLITRREDLADV